MRVIQRQKGTNSYYYLQHSYRRDSKIITKERYLGKEIPQNIKELEKKLLQETQENFIINKLEAIRINFQKVWEAYPPSARERELQEMAINFTYNTNAIEGSQITEEETRTLLIDQIAPNRPIRDIKETEAHSKLFYQMLETNEIISKELILKWHYDLLNGSKPDIAGRYRMWQVMVGSYQPPDASKIEKQMNLLFDFINSSTMNPVDTAIRAHYIFVKIHPFGDGNGRIGRLLMNYILWKNGYPMFVTENTKKQAYYEALNKTEEGFRNYLMRRYIATYRKKYQKTNTEFGTP